MWWHNDHRANCRVGEWSSEKYTYNSNYNNDDADNDENSCATGCPSFDAPLVSAKTPILRDF